MWDRPPTPGIKKEQSHILLTPTVLTHVGLLAPAVKEEGSIWARDSRETKAERISDLDFGHP